MSSWLDNVLQEIASGHSLKSQPIRLKPPFDDRRAFEAEIDGWEAGLEISRARCREFHANHCVLSVSMFGEVDGHRPHRLIAIEGIEDPDMVRICPLDRTTKRSQVTLVRRFIRRCRPSIRNSHSR